MDIEDILMNKDLPVYTREAFLRFWDSTPESSFCVKVLTPTDSNDDINGSQHVENGGTDFTYRDVLLEDVLNASTLGYYEHFSDCGSVYTGNQYHGSGYLFSAIVVDPPSYAATFSV